MERTDIDRGLTAEDIDRVRMAEEMLTRDEFGNLVRQQPSPKKTEIELREEGALLGVLVVILLALSGWVLVVGLN